MNRRLARCILVARQEDRLVTADEALEKRCEALDIFLRPVGNDLGNDRKLLRDDLGKQVWPTSVMTTTIRRASACEASRRSTLRPTMSATTRLARDGSMRSISAIMPTVTSPAGCALRTASSTSRCESSRPGAAL